MIPTIGLPRTISAMLTVYSLSPAMNSRVPSSGSTRKNRSPSVAGAGRAAASSDTTGTSGNRRDSPSRMIFSDASSAAVTGDRFALSRSPSAEAGTDRMAAAACEAISVSSSSSRWSRGAVSLRCTKRLPFGAGRPETAIIRRLTSRIAGWTFAPDSRRVALYETVLDSHCVCRADAERMLLRTAVRCVGAGPAVRSV